MALLTSEIQRIKFELGYALLSNSAAPWVDTVSIFEQVIQPYLQAGATTTSSTTVSASSAPTPVTLVLASADGVASGDRLVVDVDIRQEIATIQSLTGTSAVVLLQKAHTGTYPVTVEGGESLVREVLGRIADVKLKLSANYGAGALKKVDEVEWYQAGKGATYFGVLGENLRFWRNELASMLGIANAWESKRAAAQRLSVY